MTPRRRCSDAAGLLWAVTRHTAGAARTAARHLHIRALARINGRRASHSRRQRVRAEIHVLRAAEQIVGEHAARCRALYDLPHFNHPNHTRV